MFKFELLRLINYIKQGHSQDTRLGFLSLVATHKKIIWDFFLLFALGLVATTMLQSNAYPQSAIASSSIEKAKSNAKAIVNTCPKGSKRRSPEDVKLFLQKHDLFQKEIASSIENYSSGNLNSVDATNRLNEFVVKFNQIGFWAKGKVTDGACGPTNQTELIGKVGNTSFILIDDYKFLLSIKVMSEKHGTPNAGVKIDPFPYEGDISNFLGGKVWKVVQSTSSFKAIPDIKKFPGCEIHFVKSEQFSICNESGGAVDSLRELECTKLGDNRLSCNSIIEYSSPNENNLKKRSKITYLRVLDTLTITENLAFEEDNIPIKIITIARLLKK